MEKLTTYKAYTVRKMIKGIDKEAKKIPSNIFLKKQNN